LDSALIRFKTRHGLAANNEIDSATIAWLNEPFSNKISTIITNLERWRWLPENLGSSYLKVNMADFRLELINEGRSEFSSAVIIGTPYHSTPAFSADLIQIILNPYWYVPKSIVSNEILLTKDPISYIKTHHMEVLNNSNEVVELDSSNWNLEKADVFPYTIRQKPGPYNALGLIKFVMPNSYSVYIHDTPDRHLFHERYRLFSHGCIRVQEPFKLAALLLQDQSEWDLDSMLTIAKENQLPKTIDLPAPVPVHVFYWTAWIDQWQQVNFRKDVYLRDQTLLAAIQSSPK
jgi:murein L,D-transpeptidase YcbB/YkuD